MKGIIITIDTREFKRKLDKAVKAIKEAQEYNIKSCIEVIEQP